MKKTAKEHKARRLRSGANSMPFCPCGSVAGCFSWLLLSGLTLKDVCYICTKLGIKGDKRTKTGCKMHNKFICSKYPNHLTIHLC